MALASKLRSACSLVILVGPESVMVLKRSDSAGSLSARRAILPDHFHLAAVSIQVSRMPRFAAWFRRRTDRRPGRFYSGRSASRCRRLRAEQVWWNRVFLRRRCIGRSNRRNACLGRARARFDQIGRCFLPASRSRRAGCAGRPGNLCVVAGDRIHERRRLR